MRAETIKGIFIMNAAGNLLFDFVNDEYCEVNPSLLCAFVAALSQLGQENLGKITEIQIKGLELDMIVVTRHELVLIALLDPDLPKLDVRQEAEQALAAFDDQYHHALEDWDGNQAHFQAFKQALQAQIRDYLAKAARSKENLFNKLLVTRGDPIESKSPGRDN